MGLFGNLRDKVKRAPLDDIDVGDMRSHVLGNKFDVPEPNYMPRSRYAPPGLGRGPTQRTVNIGMPTDEPLPPEPMPMQPLGMRPTFEEQAPMSMPVIGEKEDQILDKISFLRQELSTMKDQISLINERLKNIQSFLEQRKY
ncbi:MAG: hypothetical protein ABIG30_01645 [Candidatus Aenigmatarchaeota archaeon]